MADDLTLRRRRYRRFVVATAFILGVAFGVGLGSLAALTARWELILLLVAVTGLRVVARLVARSKGIPETRDPVAWVSLAVALVVAPLTFILVPPTVAAVGLGLAIAAWFGLIVIAGVLDVALDPDGRIGGTPE